MKNMSKSPRHPPFTSIMVVGGRDVLPDVYTNRHDIWRYDSLHSRITQRSQRSCTNRHDHLPIDMIASTITVEIPTVRIYHGGRRARHTFRCQTMPRWGGWAAGATWRRSWRAACGTGAGTRRGCGPPSLYFSLTLFILVWPAEAVAYWVNIAIFRTILYYVIHCIGDHAVC